MEILDEIDVSRPGRWTFWKKMAGNPGLFFPEVDQKEKVGQKSASFFVKRSKKTKNCQKNAFLIVKRSKKSKNGQKSAFLIVKRSKNQKMVKKVQFYFLDRIKTFFLSNPRSYETVEPNFGKKWPGWRRFAMVLCR